LSIAEAMAMCRPVIACNTGGVPEIITHGRDGWLVDERSAEAVAAAMSTLLSDRELCRRLGENGRQTIRERFSPRRQAASVIQQYASLLAARGQPLPIQPTEATQESRGQSRVNN
jgi:glycosyltransferase involved in cell wall biosynthesis